MMSQNSTPAAMVSFAVASYNHARFVTQMLDSIAADNYPNYEIVILDDGSTDQSAEVIQAWIDAHPELDVRFHSRENRGVTTTLNEVISLCKGQFIKPCSSDDAIIPGSTAQMIAYLSSHPELTAAFSDGVVIDQHGNTLHDSILEFEGSSQRAYARDLERSIIGEWAVSGPLIIFNSKKLNGEKIYDEKLVIEDWYLYTKLAAKRSIGFLPIKAICYRVHTSNTSKTRAIPDRIRNLSSQKAGACSNLGLYQGALRWILKAEIALLEAKICYLQRRFVTGAPSLALYFVQKLIGRALRSLEGHNRPLNV